MACLCDVSHSLLECVHGKEGREKIVAIRGIETVHEALRSHPEDKDVQRWACMALLHLNTTDEVSRRIVDLGVVKLLRQSMQDHLQHLGVQMSALSCHCQTEKGTRVCAPHHPLNVTLDLRIHV